MNKFAAKQARSQEFTLKEREGYRSCDGALFLKKSWRPFLSSPSKRELSQQRGLHTQWTIKDVTFYFW